MRVGVTRCQQVATDKREAGERAGGGPEECAAIAHCCLRHVDVVLSRPSVPYASAAIEPGNQASRRFNPGEVT